MAVRREDADALQRLIEREQSLTTRHESLVQRRVNEWASMRETDTTALRGYCDWPNDRPYIADPLPEKISTAFADLLFGEDPVFTAAWQVAEDEKARESGSTPQDENQPDQTPDEEQAASDTGDERNDANDQERLESIIDANDLPSELHSAEEVCASEGEVWWRIYIDRAQSAYPIIEWHSRSHARPLFRGRKLAAVAFYSELWVEKVAEEYTVWRYVEIHAEGYVRNLLYKGNYMNLGQAMPLGSRQEVAGLREEWQHEFGMLAGRIPNKLGRDKRYGISVYSGVRELIYSLNEASTIGHENARLVLKKRAVVPASALGEDGRFDASEDVLIADEELDTELGGGKSAKFAVLEYNAAQDSAAVIAHKEDLSNIILTRCGIVKQFVNTGAATGDGTAESGTALRVRLIPTTLSAKGKSRFWDDQLPKIIMLAQQIDSLDETMGGFGRPWTQAEEPPVVERSEPLPQDETEEVNRHGQAVTTEIESRKTAIREMHPDWTDEQVDEEWNQIKEELDVFGMPKGLQLQPPPPSDGAQVQPQDQQQGGEAGAAQGGQAQGA